MGVHQQRRWQIQSGFSHPAAAGEPRIGGPDTSYGVVGLGHRLSVYGRWLTTASNLETKSRDRA